MERRQRTQGGDLHSCRDQFARVGFAFVAQHVILVDDDQRPRQPGEPLTKLSVTVCACEVIEADVFASNVSPAFSVVELVAFLEREQVQATMGVAVLVFQR